MYIIFITTIIIILIIIFKKNNKETFENKNSENTENTEIKEPINLDNISILNTLEIIKNNFKNIFSKITNEDVTINKNLIVNNNISNTGSIKSTGTIRSSAPGQLLNTVLKKNLIKHGQVFKERKNWVNMVTINYEPVSDKSNIYINYNGGHYNVSGYGSESIRSRIMVLDDIIANGYQRWVEGPGSWGGGGNRSGSLFPLSGYYVNNNKKIKSIQIQLYTKHTDDDIKMFNPDTLIIQEYSR